MKGTYLLFDIGASKIRLALTRDGKRFFSPVILPTPRDFKKGMALIKETVHKMNPGKLAGAAGGIAGPLDQKKTMAINAPNLTGWKNKPLAKWLKKIVRGPVLLENDNAVVGLGEAVFGAGRGKQIVVYYTFSTGVNGVKIVKKKIVPSFFGTESGHQLIGDNLILMDVTSGSGIKKITRHDASAISSRVFWNRIAGYMADGLYNSILHWSPEIVILGGGIMRSIKLSDVKSALKIRMKIFKQIPEIKKARLGEVGGLYGAMVLLRQE